MEACAAGILEISAWNQANALRRITTKRGLDVRDFPMVTFGGSGSLLACRLMDILDIPVVLVPPNPGNVSAYGLLTVDVRNDYVRTAVAPDQGLNLESLGQIYDALTEQAREALAATGLSRSPRRSSSAPRTCGTWVRPSRFGSPARTATSPDDGPTRWSTAFHDAHRALYGYDFRGKADQAVEWVNLRVTGIGPIPRPKIGEIATRTGMTSMTAIGTRPMYCDEWLDAAIYDRARLAAGETIGGPAVIQEFGSTVPVFPGFRATVDSFGNLLITRSEAP